MSLRWTEEQLAEYEVRRGENQCIQAQNGNGSGGRDVSSDDGPERTLQSKSQKFLDEHGYFYFHDRSRGDNQRGLPDLVVALPGGRTAWIELKTKTGRLRPDQIQSQLKLMSCGHVFRVVRSYKAFVATIQELIADAKATTR